MSRAKKLRKRCSECRCWFLPSPGTAHNQKTCGGEECRKRRANRLTRRRRRGSLQDSRVDERQRQHESRQRRTQSHLVSPTMPQTEEWKLRDEAVTGETMSLAGDILELVRNIDEIGKMWDIFSGAGDSEGHPWAAMSLAGARLQLVRITEEMGEKLGQVGQNAPLVTDRRVSGTISNCSRMSAHSETACHSPAMTGAPP